MPHHALGRLFIRKIAVDEIVAARRHRAVLIRGFDRVEYGIESYYIPEGKGWRFARPGLEVEIAVAPSGEAVIKRVLPPKS